MSLSTNLSILYWEFFLQVFFLSQDRTISQLEKVSFDMIHKLKNVFFLKTHHLKKK